VTNGFFLCFGPRESHQAAYGTAIFFLFGSREGSADVRCHCGIMADPDVQLDVTADDQPAPKLPDKLTGFFKQYDPNDPEQVAAKQRRERNEAERERKRRDEEQRRQAQRLLQAAEGRKKAEAERQHNFRKRKTAELEAAKALLQDNTVQLERQAAAPAPADTEQAQQQPAEQPPKKKGRPPGVKNKSSLDGRPKKAVLMAATSAASQGRAACQSCSARS
jgi:hypothetical protein